MKVSAVANLFAGALVILVALSEARAKEYNETEGIAPEQQVKIDKAVAKSQIIDNSIDAGTDGALHSDGEVNTGCGELSIGNVETTKKYGRQPLKVDRDIIITGDVINVATDCKRTGR